MARSIQEVDAAYAAAMTAGATDNGAPRTRLRCDPRYDAVNVLDRPQRRSNQPSKTEGVDSWI